MNLIFCWILHSFGAKKYLIKAVNNIQGILSYAHAQYQRDANKIGRSREVRLQV